jgi:hypothetical protein
MKPEKFGIAIDAELASYLWELSGLVRKHRNAVVVRMLEIAREDIAAFDGAGLRRLFNTPWQITRSIPTLRKQIEKRSHVHLTTTTATRLTMRDKLALRKLAERQRTSMSAIERAAVQKILASGGE